MSKKKKERESNLVNSLGITSNHLWHKTLRGTSFEKTGSTSSRISCDRIASQLCHQKNKTLNLAT